MFLFGRDKQKSLYAKFFLSHLFIYLFICCFAICWIVISHKNFFFSLHFFTIFYTNWRKAESYERFVVCVSLFLFCTKFLAAFHKFSSMPVALSLTSIEQLFVQFFSSSFMNCVCAFYQFKTSAKWTEWDCFFCVHFK